MAEFEIRTFVASDIFVVARIVRKAEIGDIKGIMSADSLQEIVNSSKGEDGSIDIGTAGVGLMLDLLDKLLEKLDNIEADLMRWLGSMSGIDDVGSMPAGEFVELIDSVVESDGFSDFFTAVGKLLRKKKELFVS